MVSRRKCVLFDSDCLLLLCLRVRRSKALSKKTLVKIK